MPKLRPSWSSVIKLGPLSIPINGYSSRIPNGSRVSLKRVHAGCFARIEQKLSCAFHGELGPHEIANGYQYLPDQWVTITRKEINDLRPDPKQPIDIVHFVSRRTVDPIRFAGTHYYLLPSNPPARQPYAILHRAMLDERVCGIAQAVIYQRDRLVMLRPMRRLLAISVLRYAEAVRPVTAFDANLGSSSITAHDLELAKSLITARRDERPHLEEFYDPYPERLNELIAAKMAEGFVVA